MTAADFKDENLAQRYIDIVKKSNGNPTPKQLFSIRLIRKEAHSIGDYKLALMAYRYLDNHTSQKHS